MKPGHHGTAIKTELGHINTTFYWFINLKMNVDHKTTLICVQPILDSIVPYLIPKLFMVLAHSQNVGVQVVTRKPRKWITPASWEVAFLFEKSVFQ